MTLLEMLLQELKNEAVTTRKMLERIPEDKFDWKPHEKSMSVRQLATHISELPTWVSMALTTSELDFANHPYQPEKIDNRAQLLAFFERCLADGQAHLSTARKEQLSEKWTLRNGEQVYSVMSKGEVIRMALSQVIHHRAQLGVYLRLLNVPIPGSYGPSADEPNF